MHVLRNTSAAITGLRSTQAQQPVSTRHELTGAGPSNASQFAASSNNQLRLTTDGAIWGPTGKLGQMDASFNFTLQVGGQTVQGNLVELMVRAMVEQVMGQLTSGLNLGSQNQTGPFAVDGRNYESMPMSHPTTGSSIPGSSTRFPTSFPTGSTSTPGTSMPGTSGVSTRTGSTSTPGTSGTQQTRESREVAASVAAYHARRAENEALPIWRGLQAPSDRDAFLNRMNHDTHTLAEKQAAIARLDAFAREMGWGVELTALHENRSTFMPEAFASGLIYDDAWYAAMRGMKQTLTDDLKRSLGRDPTMAEVYQYIPQLGQLPYDTNTIDGILQTQQRAILRDAGTSLTQYSDTQVRDGVNDYIRSHPGASEAEIRLVAKNQFGISDAQLDRVKTTYFSGTAATTPATTTATPVTTTATPAVTTPAVTTASTPTPSTPRFSDSEVADGVREYIRNNPGASEAQIRQVAQSQYGISTEQLDRVKAAHFS